MGEVRQWSMVTLPRHTPLGPRQPQPGFPALDQVRDAPKAEMASSSQSEPPLVSTPSASALTADPTATARGIMAHINSMVDLMLTGPLAEFCQEEQVNCYNGSLCRFVLSNKAT